RTRPRTSQSLLELGGGPPVSNRFLLKWMFTFLRPVRGMVILSALFLAGYVGAEVLTVRQTAAAVNQIKALRSGDSAASGAWAWFWGASDAAGTLRGIVFMLLFYTVAMGVLRYLREVSGSRLAM